MVVKQFQNGGRPPFENRYMLEDIKFEVVVFFVPDRYLDDSAITVTDDLKPRAHINSAVTKAHLRANAILRCFLSRNIDMLKRAFIVYVRPLLEYNSVVWSPQMV